MNCLFNELRKTCGFSSLDLRWLLKKSVIKGNTHKTHAHTCSCIYTHIQTHIHIHIYMYTHAYIMNKHTSF